MEIISATEFRRLPGTRLRPGDVLLFDRTAARGDPWYSGAIRRVQRRMLLDLGLPEAEAADSCRYSHAAMYAGEGCYVEMTSPACRLSLMANIAPGTALKVRRPWDGGGDAPEDAALEAAEAAAADARRRLAYPLRELLAYYLWSWGAQKLVLGRAFMRVFDDPSSDVCSGSVWRWLRSAGLFADADGGDALPAAWYPARLAADGNRFRTASAWIVA